MVPLAPVGRGNEDARVDDEHSNSVEIERQSRRLGRVPSNVEIKSIVFPPEFIGQILSLSPDFERCLRWNVDTPDEVLQAGSTGRAACHLADEVDDGQPPCRGSRFEDGGDIIGKVQHPCHTLIVPCGRPRDECRGDDEAVEPRRPIEL